MIRILTFSSLYPSAAQPRHGLFVEQRLRQLVGSGEVSASVIAPVPWFPLRGERYGRYGRYAATPRHEVRHGIPISHPRYPVVPRIGMNVAPLLMRRFCAADVRHAFAARPAPVLIDAHYFYPDGVAAAALARRLDVPCVITARGSDINLIADYPLPRRRILAAARDAAGIVTVSAALRERLVELGAPAERIVVLRNGVDPELFFPLDREQARAATGIDKPTLLSVGNLVELKGHHLVIEALTRLPRHDLVIVGDGPERAALERHAREHDVAERVRFTGSIDQARLREFYSAADLLVLASSREGMANVLLESLACGTPVVAVAVGGNPEVVAAPEAGLLVDERSPGAIAGAVEALSIARPALERTLAYARRFSWEATTAGQVELFRTILSKRARR